MTSSNDYERDILRLVNLALEEDLGVLGSGGDRTTRSFISGNQKGSALFVSRTKGILAGLYPTECAYKMVGRSLELYEETTAPPEKLFSLCRLETPSFSAYLQDGNQLHPGTQIARVEGPVAAILAAERTALNFLQHLSGIATLTWQYVKAIEGLPCKILDTRKTLPGWRLLEKYAVRCGGGFNHRLGLYDGVLIKDNHLAALGGGADAIRQSIQLAREKNGPEIPIEIEVENLNLLDVAFASRPDIVLLDNMSPGQLKEAVRRRNEKAPPIQLEASGGIMLENVRAVAETGVDRISVGALTHSAPALDIALDYETV